MRAADKVYLFFTPNILVELNRFNSLTSTIGVSMIGDENNIASRVLCPGLSAGACTAMQNLQTVSSGPVSSDRKSAPLPEAIVKFSTVQQLKTNDHSAIADETRFQSVATEQVDDALFLLKWMMQQSGA